MKLPWRMPAFGPAIETSLTTAEATEIQRLAAGRQHVLEIGAAYGYSTVLLAQVADEVVSIDPHQVHNSLAILTRNLDLYGVREKVDVRIGSSRAVLPTLSDRQFGLVFVDGDHTLAGVRFDAEQAWRLVSSFGHIAFHDWDEETCPDVRPALEAWCQPTYLIDTLAVYGG